MDEYVSIRTNWSSINSLSLQCICDVTIEENDQSIILENKEEIRTRQSATSDETINTVILRTNDKEKQDDPMIILNICQPNEYSINSIQILSNGKHIEFYEDEYIGTCQGSRITKLEENSIYECSFQFNRFHKELILKCLKLADTNDLIVYCIQIALIKRKIDSSSILSENFPFDLNRVRSMVDETNLSNNARQFLNNLQHIQEQRRTKDRTSQSFNLNSMMTMIQGMRTSSIMSSLIPAKTTPDESKSILTDDKIQYDQINTLEIRLQKYIDQRFIQLQQHIDERFNRLEEKLTNTSQT